jgi:simple sugar transport system permease protein
MNIVDLLNAALRIASPLMLAAFGGVLSERAGVFAVGLEGMMLAGAFGAAIGSALGGGVVPGLLTAAACGAAIGLVVALVAVRARADHMVTGLAVNILAYGATSYGVRLAPSDLPTLAPSHPWASPCWMQCPSSGHCSRSRR